MIVPNTAPPPLPPSPPATPLSCLLTGCFLLPPCIPYTPFPNPTGFTSKPLLCLSPLFHVWPLRLGFMLVCSQGTRVIFLQHSNIDPHCLQPIDKSHGLQVLSADVLTLPTSAVFLGLPRTLCEAPIPSISVPTTAPHPGLPGKLLLLAPDSPPQPLLYRSVPLPSD